MSPIPRKTFALTHRPKDGVTDVDCSALVKYCRSKCEYYKVITEKEGTDRHIHAALFMKKEQRLDNLIRSVFSLFPDLRPEEKMVLRQGIKVSGNVQWLDYLEKGDHTVVIADNLPERAHLEAFYPAKDEKRPYEKKNFSYYMKLEKLYYEHADPGRVKNPQNCRHFLFDMMYNKRLIDVIRDDKSIIQVSRHLARFLNKVTESVIERDVENDSFKDDV